MWFCFDKEVTNFVSRFTSGTLTPGLSVNASRVMTQFESKLHQQQQELLQYEDMKLVNSVSLRI